MTTRCYPELLAAQCAQQHYLCVGLDSRYADLPAHLRTSRWTRSTDHPQLVFNQHIIDATLHVVGSYKANFHFYLSQGPAGFQALIDTVEYLNHVAPGIPFILDYKTGDVENTNKEIAEVAFDVVGADAATFHNYMGSDAMAPILERRNNGIIVLCRTSNPGAGQFQDVNCRTPHGPEPFWVDVARTVQEYWNVNGNCGMVMGAPYVPELEQVRGIVGDMPLLIPGIGRQGGDVAAVVRAGIPQPTSLATINSSSAITFAFTEENERDYAAVARRQAEQTNQLILAANPGAA